MKNTAPDLDACSREPIHMPGSIQPHGMFLAIERKSGVVAAISANAGLAVACAPADALNLPFAEVAPIVWELFGTRLGGDLPDDRAARLGQIRLGELMLEALAYTTGDLIVLELEHLEEPVRQALGADFEVGGEAVAALVQYLQPQTPDDDAYRAVAETVRRITGFDRVLVYRFDHDHVGTVIAEDGNGVLPSYLGLRFPASDIPPQARELYRINRTRQIPDAGYTPVPILRSAGRPTPDLSQSVLRSVSPVHLEYMRNMGTAASMSVSILQQGRLWGLISCHHASPYRTSPAVRAAADLVAQILSMRITAASMRQDAIDRAQAQQSLSRLLKAMAKEPAFIDGLAREQDALLAMTGAAGVAIVQGDDIVRIGEAPGDDEIRAIVSWLDTEPDDGVIATCALPRVLPGARGFADLASGVLSVSLSRVHSSRLLWFRPELVRTVRWGGQPGKEVEGPGPDARISPRRSFAAWQETVRGTSQAWTAADMEAARALRTAIVDIVLRKAEELAAISEDLAASNKELEAFSYSVSHDLRAPFRHIAGYAELLSERERDRLDDKSRHYLGNIIEAAHTAGKLVDDLLHFSQMSRVTVRSVGVDMDKLVQEVCRSLLMETSGRQLKWQIAELPPANGDPSLLRQVLLNLVSNAVKYTRDADPAVIEIGGWAGETENTYYVRDNGIGFDMAYAEKLFQVFQRLNRTEDFEGTGIGLALARRILERHGGRVWASAQPGRGATFYFALPVRPPPEALAET